MSPRHLIGIVLIGIVAGYFAGKIMKGKGFGLVGDFVVGILGAWIGGWLFGIAGVGIDTGMIVSIVVSTIGALVLLFVIRLVKKA